MYLGIQPLVLTLKPLFLYTWLQPLIGFISQLFFMDLCIIMRSLEDGSERPVSACLLLQPGRKKFSMIPFGAEIAISTNMALGGYMTSHTYIYTMSSQHFLISNEIGFLGPVSLPR